MIGPTTCQYFILCDSYFMTPRGGPHPVNEDNVNKWVHGSDWNWIIIEHVCNFGGASSCHFRGIASFSCVVTVCRYEDVSQCIVESLYLNIIVVVISWQFCIVSYSATHTLTSDTHTPACSQCHLAYSNVFKTCACLGANTWLRAAQKKNLNTSNSLRLHL